MHDNAKKGEQEMAVTMQQIADLAGVSRGTVDRALNNRGRIRPEVAEKIKMIAKELGYQPNIAAKALSSGNQILRIGVILQYADTPTIQTVLEGAKDAKQEVERFGGRVMIDQIKGGDVRQVLDIMRGYKEAGMKGIVLMPSNDEMLKNTINRYVDDGIEIITINSDLEDTKRRCFVGQDNYAGGCVAGGLMGEIIPDGGKVMIISGSADNTATVNSVTESITQRFDKDSEKSTIPDEGSIFSRIAEHGGAEMDDGASFVSFRVDHTGSINDSFISSLKDNDMQDRINSVSNSARNMKFELSGGNINETMTAALGHVTNIVRDVVGGYIDGIGIAGVATLQGAGLVDIPQHWASSSVNIGKSNYSFTLMPMYNTPISRLLHQVVPLAMILAGVLPLSTGKQSYTSPFICEYYDKGRCQDRLAMITDVSISRGAANTPYNLHGDCLGIDVTFSVTGMSRMMHMPLVSSFSLNPFEGTFDEETIFTDYMAVLSGLGMTEQVYRFRRLALNITQKKAAWDSYWSAARFGTFIANVPPVRLLDVFYDGRR